MGAPLIYYRRIDLANATCDELEQLVGACEHTSSDVDKNAMTDGPAKMDPGSFAPLLVPVQTNLVKVIRDYHLEGDKSSQRLKMELRELNVYSAHFHRSLLTFKARQTLKSTHVGKGSFYRPRVELEALSDKSMLGSLVIIFPTPHKGGVMSLRSRTGHECSFDPSPETSDITHNPSIGYVVLFKDVEHEVEPITSGHRVTLTYDLYAENDDGPISTKFQQTLEPIPPLANEREFHDVFASLLENREFLAEGGILAFGLANAYSIRKDFKHVYDALKGSDAVVFRTLRALGFEPVLRMYYHEWEPSGVDESLDGHAAVFDEVVDFSDWNWDEEVFIPDFVHKRDGQIVPPEDLQEDPDFEYLEGEAVVWVTPVTTFNRKESAFGSPATHRYTATNVAYGDLCLFVRIGKAGDRLSYPRVPQSERDDDEATSSEGEDMNLNEEAISVDSESQGSED